MIKELFATQDFGSSVLVTDGNWGSAKHCLCDCS